MHSSETIGQLVAALAHAQGEFDAAVKSSVNPHFRSRYADLETIINATAPALRSHGLVVVQTFGHLETGEPSLRTTLAHSSGEWIAGEQILLMGKHDPQSLAGASTYARRYGWQAIVGIAAEDDDGETATSRPPQSRPEPRPEPQPAPQPKAKPLPHPTNGTGEVSWTPKIEACTDLDAAGRLWATELKPWIDSGGDNAGHRKNTANLFWAHVAQIVKRQMEGLAPDKLATVLEEPLLQSAPKPLRVKMEAAVTEAMRQAEVAA